MVRSGADYYYYCSKREGDNEVGIADHRRPPAHRAVRRETANKLTCPDPNLLLSFAHSSEIT